MTTVTPDIVIKIKCIYGVKKNNSGLLTTSPETLLRAGGGNNNNTVRKMGETDPKKKKGETILKGLQRLCIFLRHLYFFSFLSGREGGGQDGTSCNIL